MKLAIIGSRTFTDYEYLKERVLSMIESVDEIECIISGGAKGVDTLAEIFAKEFNIKTEIYLPQWDVYGKAAGMIRNKTIIDSATKVIAFWDNKSKGTKNGIELAMKRENLLKVFAI